MTNLVSTVPMLHVAEMAAALEFYRDRLGFEQTSEYRLDPESADPAYVVLHRDGAWLHVSSFSGDGKPGGVAVTVVRDVDALHREFGDRGVEVGDAPMDQTWGNREMYLRDPDGNQLRYMQPLDRKR